MSTQRDKPFGSATQKPSDQAQPQDEMRAEKLLEEALDESFPASDPVSSNRFN